MRTLHRAVPGDGLLSKASVAIDSSKFKAVNNSDRNFTRGKVELRRKQLEESVARYLSELDTIDLHEPTEALAPGTVPSDAQVPLAIEKRLACNCPLTIHSARPSPPRSNITCGELALALTPALSSCVIPEALALQGVFALPVARLL